ncbi:MAG: homoserine O-succinyltransferase [Proteobacteria bacterium]|nr:homoserine O-succinyltransferase [Pseudomonadota bacterium]MBS0463676.1 homoserine O-succinyltransferase [Pseudomonadota bacterium]
MSLVATLPAARAVSPITFPPYASLLPAAAGACSRGELDASLSLRHAGPRQVRIGWQRLGESDLPVVVVQGGISAHRRAAAGPGDQTPGWWQAQIGPGLPLDPGCVQLVSIDWLGSDGAIDAPIDTADQADAIAAVLEHLGIVHVAAFVGCSYGALVGLQVAVRHPALLGRLIAIAGAHRPHPYASALRAIQRKIVALGQLQCADEIGVSLARQLGMLTYRTPAEFAQRFAAPAALEGERARCASEDYLEACGERFVRSHAATAFVRLSESIDLHQIEPGDLRVPATLVAVDGDVLTPPADAFALAERAHAPVRVRVLRSLYGHDAFLKDVEPIAAILREGLRDAATAGCLGGVA